MTDFARRVHRRLRAIVILAGLCAACGVAPDAVTESESPAYIGTVHLRNDGNPIVCQDPTTKANVSYRVVEVASQTFTRPIQANGYLPNYYTTTIALAQFDSVSTENNLSFNCSPALKIPVSPVCGGLNAICSTGGATCAVYTRTAGQTAWRYRGSANMWGLTYLPLTSYTGSYITALDGAGISALGCASVNFTLGA